MLPILGVMVTGYLLCIEPSSCYEMVELLIEEMRYVMFCTSDTC